MVSPRDRGNVGPPSSTLTAMTTCDDAALAVGDFCEGDGECGTRAARADGRATFARDERSTPI